MATEVRRRRVLRIDNQAGNRENRACLYHLAAGIELQDRPEPLPLE
jgi:hypothetical protein